MKDAINRYKLKDFTDKNPEQVLNMLDLNEPDFDPIKIANKMGIDVIRDINLEYIKNNIEGQAFVDDNKLKIWMNPMLSSKHFNFTLAHEIGHVVWDILPKMAKKENDIKPFNDHGETLSFNCDGSSSLSEYNANNFAGRLLMPGFAITKEIDKIIDKNKNNENANTIGFIVPRLSDAFQAPQQAVTIRLIRLGIITGA